jgi:signal transduction histidine kinase
VRAAGAAARMALENERLHAEVKAQLEEVRASRARIIEAGDAERRRVERDLHDGAQQRLVSLSLALRSAQDRVGDDAAASAAIEEAEHELQVALAELRELARGIHPAILTEEGLSGALESLAMRSPVPVTIDADSIGRLPPAIEATAYFAVSEALANVAKHAGASHATVSAHLSDRTLLVEIRDDGMGGADVANGSGLRGLADRVAAVGGELTVSSPVRAGTRVRAEIPCG